jgi:hypothetical protein
MHLKLRSETVTGGAYVCPFDACWLSLRCQTECGLEGSQSGEQLKKSFHKPKSPEKPHASPQKHLWMCCVDVPAVIYRDRSANCGSKYLISSFEERSLKP